jgi:YVTN family beta-propeller protein
MSGLLEGMSSHHLSAGSSVQASLPLGINGAFLSSASSTSLSFYNSKAYSSKISYNISVGIEYSGVVPSSVISNKIVGTIHGQMRGPMGMAFDNLNGYLYVINWGSSSVSYYNTFNNNQYLGSVPGLSGPLGITFDPANNHLYVTENSAKSVAVINATNNKITDVIGLADQPFYIDYDPYTGYVYVTTYNGFNGGPLLTIDPSDNQIINSVHIGSSGATIPSGVQYDPSNGYLYIDGGFNEWVINPFTETVTAKILINSPWGVAFDSSNGLIFITASYSAGRPNPGFPTGSSNTVYVVNGTSNVLTNTITVGENPTSIVYDPANKYVYVTNVYSSNVSIINSANLEVAATVDVGTYPGVGANGILYNSYDGDIYVPNYNDNNISIISGSTQLPFKDLLTPSSLPPEGRLNGGGAIVATGSTQFVSQEYYVLQDNNFLVSRGDNLSGQVFGSLPIVANFSNGLISFYSSILNLSGIQSSISENGIASMEINYQKVLSESWTTGEPVKMNMSGVVVSAQVYNIVLNSFSYTITSSYISSWSTAFYNEFGGSALSSSLGIYQWSFSNLPFVATVYYNNDTMTIQSSSFFGVNSISLTYYQASTQIG